MHYSNTNTGTNHATNTNPAKNTQADTCPNSQSGETAIVVHLSFADKPHKHQTNDHDHHPTAQILHQNNDLAEFYLLAQSAGACIVATITGKRNRPHAKYFVGTGKADEIAQQVQACQAHLVLFNHSLSPSQTYHLSQLFGCRVVDRTGLILDIFAARARTYEAKLQVELAQLTYMATRLRSVKQFSRQGGGIGLRGPGETQLETDKRLLQLRKEQLKAKLEKVKQYRRQGRSRRQKSDVYTIALVGYTNAGKSTLFNRLTDNSVYVADQLFATLDPTLRHVHWAGIGKLVLADTVGFVKNLDHQLVESFHATLEEVLEADLLLHVIDKSSPHATEEIQAVNSVLQQIGADVPMLLVYNKIDKTGHNAHIHYDKPHHPASVSISATTGMGIDKLIQAVTQRLMKDIKGLSIDIPNSQGALISTLHALGIVSHIQYNEQGRAHIRLQSSYHQLKHLLAQHQLQIDDVLLDDDGAKSIAHDNTHGDNNDDNISSRLF